MTPEPATRYPVALTIPILWGDMDALAHVNNIQYFKQFEAARMEYFRIAGITAHFERTRVGPILATTTCRFLWPVQYPDSVVVHTGVSELRTTSFTMLYKTYGSGGTRLAAEGSGVIVMYDYGRGEKTPIPEELRAAIVALEKTGA